MTQEPYMPIDVELSPCPFCGEKAVLTNVRQSGHSFAIGCVNESCWRPRTDYYDTQASVVGLWNGRAELHALQQQLASAREEHAQAKREWYQQLTSASAVVIAQVKALLIEHTVMGLCNITAVHGQLSSLQPDPYLAVLPLDAREQALQKKGEATCAEMAGEPTAQIDHLEAEARRLLQLKTEPSR